MLTAPPLIRLFLLILFFTLIQSESSGTTENSHKNNKQKDKFTISWNAPFLATHSGYGAEATSFLLGLNATLNGKWNIAAGLAHGDAVDWDLVATLPEAYVGFLQRVSHQQYTLTPHQTIIICHSEPGAWNVLEGPRYESASPCPPPLPFDTTQPWYAVIGRTMFETDRLPDGWQHRLNAMTELWVPSQHQARIFQEGGVTQPIVVVGQGIDAQEQWNPGRVEPLPWERVDPEGRCSEEDYKFLSVFKWENRKGHDVLIKSFWRAFLSEAASHSQSSRGACLVICTSLYHEDADAVVNKLQECWLDVTGQTDFSPQGPHRLVLVSRLPTEDLVRLYKTADAFVLPSRGEGWGRPYMEAMAMGLPVIATNWSGPTEFVTQENGYLLPITGLVDAQLEAFPGHLWAEPDSKALQEIMRKLVENPEEGRQKGHLARKNVVEQWSNRAMADVVVKHLERLAFRSVRPMGDDANLVKDEL